MALQEVEATLPKKLIQFVRVLQHSHCLHMLNHRLDFPAECLDLAAITNLGLLFNGCCLFSGGNVEVPLIESLHVLFVDEISLFLDRRVFIVALLVVIFC